MNTFRKFAFLSAVLYLVIQSQIGLAQSAPAESIVPLDMMAELSVLEGRWEMTMEVVNEETGVWQTLAPEMVDLTFRQKGLMLAEIPADLSSPAFHMETYITFDQYRNVYRKVAVDDVWGIMDIYDGSREGDSIVFNNLRSGTTFPVADGVWRNFRLTLQLSSPTRTFLVEKSDNSGESWEPAFRSTYVLQKS